MARPNESDVPPKRTKKVRLGVYRTQIWSTDHDIVAYQVSDLIWQDIRTVDTASDWLIANLGRVLWNIR